MSFPGKENYPHTGGKQFGIVVGRGGPKDQVKDPSGLGLIQVKSLTDHGPDVKVSDLALIPTKGSSQSWSDRPPLPGSAVIIEHQSGSNSSRVANIDGPSKNSPTTSTPGNENLFTADKDAMAAWTQKLGINPLPGIKETKKRGALIREVVEKSSELSTSQLKGLPLAGSIFALIEQTLPLKTSVETAKEQFSNILGSDILNSLPGESMSPGKMFSQLTKKQKKKITKNMPQDVADAFESLSYLMPTIETDSDVSYHTNTKVHLETFMTNAVDLLSQASTLSDLGHVLGRLSNDDTLFGHDKLGDTDLEIDTPFGKVKKKISHSGAISDVKSDANDAVQAIKDAFESFLGSGSTSGGAPSIAKGENLFGDSSKTMMDMFHRSAPEGLQAAVDLLNKTNKSSEAVKRNEIMRVFSEGGNLIQTFMSNLG